MNQEEFETFAKNLVKTVRGGVAKMISDCQTYIDLSGAADDLVCQYKVPGAQWGSNSLATTISEVYDITNHFSTGPQQFEAGKSYLCFYAQGLGDKLLHASVLTIGSDGNSVTIGEDYPIRFGGRVKTPRGSVYEMSRMPTSPTDTRFSDFITTTFGKWPLVRRLNGTTWFQGLSDCELTLIFNTSSANCAIGFLDCCNLTVLTDTSGMPIDSSGSTYLELYLRKKNLRFLPIGSTYFGARTSADTETANQQVAIVTGANGAYEVSNITLEGTMAYRPTYYPDEDGGVGWTITPVRTRQTNYWKTTDGKLLRLDPVIEFVNYSAAWTSVPHLEDNEQ